MEEYRHLEVSSIRVSRSDILGVTGLPNGSVYAVDGSCVYLINVSTGNAVLYAGVSGDAGSEGPRLQVSFLSPHGIGFSADNTLFVTTTGDHRVYSIAHDVVTRFAGTESGHRDGPRLEAQFHSPQRIVELDGHFYIPDCWNHCVRVISPEGMVTTIGKRSNSYLTGDFAECSIPYTRGAGVGLQKTIIVASSGPHHISQLDTVTKKMSFIAGSEKSYQDGNARTAAFDFPFDVAVHPVTGDIYVADDDNCRIRRVDASTHDVTTLIPPASVPSSEVYTSREKYKPVDGPVSEALALAPTGICISFDGDLIWSERSGYVRIIRRFAPKRRATRDHLPGFESYMDTGLFSDSESDIRGETFKLNSAILNCWNLSNSRLSQALNAPHLSTLPMLAIREFLSTLHGKPPPPPPPPSSTAAMTDTASGLSCSETTLAYWTSLAHQWMLACELFGEGTCGSIGIFSQQELSRELSGAPVNLVVRFIKYIKEQSNFTPAINMAMDSLRYRRKSESTTSASSSSLLEPSTIETTPHGGTIDRILDSMLAAELARDVKASLDSTTPSFVTLVPADALRKAVSPIHDLSSKLENLSESVAFDTPFANEKSSSISPKLGLDPNFVFTISGNPNFAIRAHDWVLYSRWTYFSTLLDSGMAEASNRIAEMPSDFPPAALLLLIQYLYTNKVTTGMKSLLKTHPHIAEYLTSNGQLYRILSDDEGTEVPVHGFSNLLFHCQVQSPSNTH